MHPYRDECRIRAFTGELATIFFLMKSYRGTTAWKESSEWIVGEVGGLRGVLRFAMELSSWLTES